MLDTKQILDIISPYPISFRISYKIDDYSNSLTFSCKAKMGEKTAFGEILSLEFGKNLESNKIRYWGGNFISNESEETYTKIRDFIIKYKKINETISNYNDVYLKLNFYSIDTFNDFIIDFSSLLEERDYETFLRKKKINKILK